MMMMLLSYCSSGSVELPTNSENYFRPTRNGNLSGDVSLTCPLEARKFFFFFVSPESLSRAQVLGPDFVKFKGKERLPPSYSDIQLGDLYIYYHHRLLNHC